ncbi:hypothetical protein COOONC_22184 [Cooperia oncophora]
MRWLILECLIVGCLAMSFERSASREQCYPLDEKTSMCVQAHAIPSNCLAIGKDAIVCAKTRSLRYKEPPLKEPL